MSIAPTDSALDADGKKSALDKLSENSLSTAGYAFLAGDAFLYAAGHLSGRKNESLASAFWFAGGLACARYGNPSLDKKLQLLSTDLSDHLRKEGIAIPNEPDTALLTRKGGIFETAENYLYPHAANLLNAAYAIGGMLLIKSGKDSKNNWDAASGALVTAGALAGIFVKEKQPDPENPPKGIVNKTCNFFQEKPLRIPATFYGLTDISLIMGALKDKRRDPTNKAYLFKFLTAATYVFGNVMLSMSEKGHAGSDKHNNAIMEKMADMSAHVIAAQPQPIRETLIEDIADHLSAKSGGKMKKEEIGALLHAKLQQLPQRNAPGDWQQYLDGKTPSGSPAL